MSMVRLEECSLENELIKASLDILGSQMRVIEVHKKMESWVQRAAAKERDFEKCLRSGDMQMVLQSNEVLHTRRMVHLWRNWQGTLSQQD